MGDRKQPTPVPTNQVRPEPPPAPPRKVDQVVEHRVSVASADRCSGCNLTLATCRDLSDNRHETCCPTCDHARNVNQPIDHERAQAAGNGGRAALEMLHGDCEDE